MKKRIICATSLSLLMLTGCSGAKASISTSSETLFTVGSTTVTQGDEYNLLKTANGGSMTLELAQHAIYDKIVPATEDMEKAAEEEYDSLASYYDDLEQQLIDIGYEGKDDYMESVLIPEQQKSALQDQYFIDNKTAIRKQYKPSIATILCTDNKDDADAALEALKNGDDVATVYEQYTCDSSSFTNEEIVVTTLNDSLPTRVINQLYKADEAGVIDEVFEADDSSTYYYIAILKTHGYDKNVETFEENIVSNSDTIETEMFTYYFTEYNFEIYDQDVFDYLKVNNPEYLVKYPELAEAAEDDE